MRAPRPRLFPLALFAAAPLAAGVDSPLAADLSLNYQPPGARAQAMGGAFIALSDDATAAAVNPAGLAALRKPELTAQFLSGGDGLDLHDYSGQYAERTGAGYPERRVVSDDLASRITNGSAQGIDFLGAAWPLRGAVVAFSWSRPVDFHADGLTLGQLYANQFLTANPPPDCQVANCIDTRVQDPPQTMSGRLRVERLSLSGAFRLGARVSAGITINRDRVRGDVRDAFYLDTNRGLPGNLRFVIAESARDAGWSGSAGLLWRPDETWSFGAAFRRGAGYRGAAEVRVVNPSVTDIRDDRFATENRLPDQLGIGAAWRPRPTFLLSADLCRVRYSQLAKGLRTFNQYQVDRNALPRSFAIDDAFEPHLGIEYLALRGGAPLVFRAGAWREARHGLRFVDGRQTFVQDPGDPQPIPDPAVYDRFVRTMQARRFPGGEAQTHLSAGLGLVVSGRLQLDMSYDHARLSQRVAFSGVWRFN